MEILESWSQIARATRLITPAGPLIPKPSAVSAVSRLRQATVWAKPLLAELSGLPEASHVVAQVDSLIVDRHRLMTTVAESLSNERTWLPASHEPGHQTASISTLMGLGGVVALRHLSHSIQGYWRFVGPHPQGILVAPNVEETAQRLDLDKGDYARWVALRTGMWGVYFTQAPWLIEYLRHVLRSLPQSLGELARVLAIVSAAVDAQLDQLTPKQIMSVNWIRRHLPRSGTSAAIIELGMVNRIVLDLQAVRSQAQAFWAHQRIEDNPDAIKVLLTSVDHLPTVDELATPAHWSRRVGLGG